MYAVHWHLLLIWGLPGEPHEEFVPFLQHKGLLNAPVALVVVVDARIPEDMVRGWYGEGHTFQRKQSGRRPEGGLNMLSRELV
jgi:hypothetical protein